MNKHLIDIIIPTWNNREYLQPCLLSLALHFTTKDLYRIIVINNGDKNSCDWVNSTDGSFTVIQAGGNLGWEGGLELGLKHSKAPFVVFMNDDTYVPNSSRLWLNQLIQHFKNPKVAAVGPSTNVVMGQQNIFANISSDIFPVSFLIGYCMMVRRSALDEVGGIDTTLPGGDDLDLSIRFRDKGYLLLADRNAFIYHHGFKSGERLRGGAQKTGGWNSFEMKEETDHALIKKHGFRKWWECLQGVYSLPKPYKPYDLDKTDIEGKVIETKVIGKKILDLGCGDHKTVLNAIGVDLVAKGTNITSLVGNPKSVADVEHDVSKPLPFEKESIDCIIARHILEHLINPLQVLRQWSASLKKGGRLIIAVPDQDMLHSIPMNIEHIHAFNRESMKDFLEASGFKMLEQIDPKNNVSFITIAEKV